jgi:type II secretory pathway component PulK
VTAALAPVADWYVGQLAEHGAAVFIAVHTVLLVAVWCAAGLVFRAHEQRQARRSQEQQTQYGIRIAENYANNPAVRAAWEHAARKEGDTR